MVVRYRQTVGYGIVLALLLFLLQWLKLQFIIVDHSFEIYAGSIAILFTMLGIWLAVKLRKPKVIETKIYIATPLDFILNEQELNRLGLTDRELEVLQLMAKGKSNQEIANHLFLSLSTIKTHSAHLFEKMDVKRRTQAIAQGKKLSLIA